MTHQQILVLYALLHEQETQIIQLAQANAILENALNEKHLKDKKAG